MQSNKIPIIPILLAPILLILLGVMITKLSTNNYSLTRNEEMENSYHTLQELGFATPKEPPTTLQKLGELDWIRKNTEYKETCSIISNSQNMVENDSQYETGGTISNCRLNTSFELTNFSFDKKTLKFTCQDRIQELENLGYPGITEMFHQAETVIANAIQQSPYTFEDAEDLHSISFRCNDLLVTITPSIMENGEDSMYFPVTLTPCILSSLLPENYAAIVENIEANTEYRLYAASLSKEKTILTFERNKSLGPNLEDGMPVSYDSPELLTQKRFSLIYEGTQVKDYFMISHLSKLELDEMDQNFFQIAGINNLSAKLSEKPGSVSISSSDAFHIFTTNN